MIPHRRNGFCGNDSYTKLLVHGNGPDGSTVIHDSAGKPNAYIQAHAKLDTDYCKFGMASILLDGTDDIVYWADSADWYFGTGDFTVDCWVRWNALPSDGQVQGLWGQFADSTHYQGMTISNSSGTYYLNYQSISTNVLNMSTAISAPVAGQFNHVCLVREITSFHFFLNGILQHTFTGQTNPADDIVANFLVGAGAGASNVYYLNGWIDEFRVSKGIARWTANFTPLSMEYR